MPLTEVKIEGFIGTICLDHFERRNAFSAALADEITKALESFVEARARVAILRARPGVKIWSAGHDIDELPKGRRDPLGWYDPLRRLVRAIENHPAPVIAMIEGGVWGGACETAMACDIIVAAPNATFALTPAKLGVPYNVSGMLTFLNSASLRIIKEMAFTAKPDLGGAGSAGRIDQSSRGARGPRAVHLCDGRRHRRQRAAIDCGDEGGIAHSRRRASDEPARLGARAGIEARRL